MPDPSPHGREAGLSLVGLLLVLLVLSLGAATTVRWYFSNAEVTLENAAVLLAQDLRAAQHRSIFLGEPTHFVFLPAGEGYVVTDEQGELAQNPLTSEPFLRMYPEDGVFIGVTVVSAQAGDDRTLVIDGRGRSLEDLSVGLAFGEERRTVRLERESGAITIQGSTSGWVDLER